MTEQADYLECADQILALIKEALPELAKEAGYIPLHSLNETIGVKSLHQWAKANGYVKLAGDQTIHEELLILPDNYNLDAYKGRRAGYYQAQQDMIKAGWRKVE